MSDECKQCGEKGDHKMDCDQEFRDKWEAEQEAKVQKVVEKYESGYNDGYDYEDIRILIEKIDRLEYDKKEMVKTVAGLGEVVIELSKINRR
jgi:hypothetical protein